MADLTPEQIALQAEGAKLESGIASIQNLETRSRAAWKKNIDGRVYPTADRARQAVRALADALPRVLRMIETGDYSGLVRLLGEVDEECRRLAIPEKNPSYEDQLRDGVALRLGGLGWISEELDALKLFWRGGDRFTDTGISSVRFNDRTVLRCEVRARLRGDARPASERNEREALLHQAANVDRVARGESPSHRSW